MRNVDKTFAEATASCQELGGFLAEPRSAAMTTAVKTLNFTSDYTWIGIKDISGYRWLTDNSTLSYNDWASGQPNSANEKCVGISESDYQWYDRPCDLEYEYICQTDERELFCIR